MTNATLHQTHKDAARGINKPQGTREGTDVAQEMTRLEAERLDALEGRYRAALVKAVDGDRKAITELARVADELGWTPERIGADQAIIASFRQAQSTMKAWTTDDEAEHQRLSNEVRALGTEKDAYRKWLDARQKVLAQRWRLDDKLQATRHARERLAELQADPHSRALLEAEGSE